MAISKTTRKCRSRRDRRASPTLPTVCFPMEPRRTIAASTETGTSFGLDVLSVNFDRGVELLADEQLHPAFKAADFSVVQQQIAGELEGEMTAPDHLASVALAKALYPAGDPSQRFATPKSIGG